MPLNLEHLHHVHCIGVGGIGVSAIAKLLRLWGKEVSGSDLQRSEVTEDAEKVGVIVKEEDPENIAPDLDLVVYTSAAPEDHPERVAAAKLGIPQMSYFEFLGLLSQGYDTIAVCGTNGKSSTTAMLGLLLEAGGLDPLVIVGSRVDKFTHGNLRDGQGDILVVEACEHQAQLLNLSPKTIVVTNIAEDHLDHYRDLDHIRDTFQEFIDKLPEDGLLVFNADDANSKGLVSGSRVVSFGFGSQADYRAVEMRIDDMKQKFIVQRKEPEEEWQHMKLKIPGRFNIQNALAAAAVARELGVPLNVIRETLAEHTGIWRRFERVGERNSAPVISDYGHHPDAVRETLTAAREFFPDRRIVLVFQPHHYDRTKKLFDAFVASFDGADALVLAEIYHVAGRVAGKGEVSSRDLVEAVKEKGKDKAWYAKDVKTALKKTEEIAEKNDVIIVMGAGSIYTIAKKIVS